MADSTPEQRQKQYAAIELLYSEGKWPEVLQASESLLAGLRPAQGHPLRPRLELVIGHTLLYGLADLAGAEQRYRAVLVGTQEQVLREIAEQGLLRCHDQRQAAAAGATAAQEPEPEEAPSPEPVGDASRAAMPWLAELGGTPTSAPAVEPVVEPVISGSVPSVRNLEATNLELAPPATTPATEAANATPAVESTPGATREKTLALLREPDEPIPVTVQALEEPPLSPDEVAELARGLLEVVLR